MKRNIRRNFRHISPRDFLIEQINADAYFTATGKVPENIDESLKSWLSGKWNQAKQIGKNVGNWAANAAGAVGNKAIDAYNKVGDAVHNASERYKEKKDKAMRKSKADMARELGNLAGGDYATTANNMADAIEQNAYQAQTRQTAPSQRFNTSREMGSLDKARRAGEAPVLAQQITTLLGQLEAQAPLLGKYGNLIKGATKQLKNVLAKIASGEYGVEDEAPQPVNDSYNPHITTRGQRMMLESIR